MPTSSHTLPCPHLPHLQIKHFFADLYTKPYGRARRFAVVLLLCRESPSCPAFQGSGFKYALVENLKSLSRVDAFNTFAFQRANVPYGR